MFKHILIATDGSERSERAIKLGVDLATTTGGKITAVMATWPIPPIYVEGLGRAERNDELEQNARDFAKRCLGVAADAAHAAGVASETVHATDTHPHEAIIRTAEANHCDLIVMASHGRAGAKAVLLGSETQKVLVHTKIPVLICR
jgi:nucleotide-binding universal stress UspA family protein